MSNLALNTGEDFPEAAARHLEDATILLAEGRVDNAAYLAGYVVECTVKTLLRIEQGEHPEVHDLASLSRQATELAALPGAKTARYAASLSSKHAIYDYDAEVGTNPCVISPLEPSRKTMQQSGWTRLVGFSTV